MPDYIGRYLVADNHGSFFNDNPDSVPQDEDEGPIPTGGGWLDLSPTGNGVVSANNVGPNVKKSNFSDGPTRSTPSNLGATSDANAAARGTHNMSAGGPPSGSQGTNNMSQAFQNLVVRTSNGVNVQGTGIVTGRMRSEATFEEDIDGEDIDGEDIDGEDIDGESIDGEGTCRCEFPKFNFVRRGLVLTADAVGTCVGPSRSPSMHM